MKFGEVARKERLDSEYYLLLHCCKYLVLSHPLQLLLPFLQLMTLQKKDEFSVPLP